jgi:acyl-CoA dehydrogenase
LRSHPYLYREIAACQDQDPQRGLAAFEAAFSGHVAFSLANLCGAMFHNLTFGIFGRVPDKAYGTAEWYRQLWRAARNFAFVADLTVAVLGGALKTKQKLSGRLADALSELYFLACVIKRYEDDAKPANDRHIVALCARNGLYRFQEALRAAIDNFPNTPVRWFMRAVVFPFGGHYRPAPDWLGHRVAELVLAPGEVRDRLTRFIFVSNDPNDPTGLLEVTMAKAVAAEAADKKLDRAVRAGVVRRVHGSDFIGEAAAKGVLNQAEAAMLRELEALTARAIAVDHFDPAELRPHYLTPGHNARAMQRAAE